MFASLPLRPVPAALCVTLLVAAGLAGAQTPGASAAPAATAAPAAPAAAASAPRSPRAPAARPHITVIEDDNARIEEHRVRGVVVKIVVHPKVGNAPPYEVQVQPPGRADMGDRGAQGRSAWSILKF
jgi:hypothetical protein